MFWQTQNSIEGTRDAYLREELRERLRLLADFATLGAYELTDAPAHGDTPHATGGEPTQRVFLFSRVPQTHCKVGREAERGLPHHGGAAHRAVQPAVDAAAGGAAARRGRGGAAAVHRVGGRDGRRPSGALGAADFGVERAQQLASGFERAPDSVRVDVLVGVRRPVVVRDRVALREQGDRLPPARAHRRCVGRQTGSRVGGHEAEVGPPLRDRLERARSAVPRRGG